MARIEVAKVPAREISARSILAKLCYFYPQYTLAQAKRLPYKDVMLLIKTAQREKAAEYYNLTQIAAAPQTDKGKGIAKLSEQYKRLADG